jgi:uncharacterized protein (TIGR03086 family)
MADVRTWLREAGADFSARVAQIGDDDWAAPTPNADWDVRTLVAHVADEQLWAPPLLAGRTIEDIGDSIPSDPLGQFPAAALEESFAGMTAALGDLDLDAPVQLSFGEVPAQEYLMQVFADHLVHSWDLARATGQDERLDPDLVRACATWFAGREDLYREGGVIGPRVAVEDPDEQADLLARFGRNPAATDTLATIVRFNTAFGAQDVDAVMALMTDDVVFEDTSPPDGGRHVGQDAVRAAWTALFTGNPDGRFTTEHAVVSGDRATYQWVYDWGEGHVRGIDLFRVRDGKVAEKLSYVKG